MADTSGGFFRTIFRTFCQEIHEFEITDCRRSFVIWWDMPMSVYPRYWYRSVDLHGLYCLCSHLNVSIYSETLIDSDNVDSTPRIESGKTSEPAFRTIRGSALGDSRALSRCWDWFSRTSQDMASLKPRRPTNLSFWRSLRCWSRITVGKYLLRCRRNVWPLLFPLF